MNSSSHLLEEEAFISHMLSWWQSDPSYRISASVFLLWPSKLLHWRPTGQGIQTGRAAGQSNPSLLFTKQGSSGQLLLSKARKEDRDIQVQLDQSDSFLYSLTANSSLLWVCYTIAEAIISSKHDLTMDFNQTKIMFFANSETLHTVLFTLFKGIYLFRCDLCSVHSCM